jgi:hypothetical protein
VTLYCGYDNIALMAKKKKTETDSAYFLKLVMYFILGTFWIRLVDVSFGPFEHLSLPLGLLIGILFASHEHFQIDRKIEYAVLLVATFISFYLPVGITI